MLHLRAAAPCELSVIVNITARQGKGGHLLYLVRFHHDPCEGKQHPSSLTPGPQSLDFSFTDHSLVQKGKAQDTEEEGRKQTQCATHKTTAACAAEQRGACSPRAWI